MRVERRQRRRVQGEGRRGARDETGRSGPEDGRLVIYMRTGREGSYPGTEQQKCVVLGSIALECVDKLGMCVQVRYVLEFRIDASHRNPLTWCVSGTVAWAPHHAAGFLRGGRRCLRSLPAEALVERRIQNAKMGGRPRDVPHRKFSYSPCQCPPKRCRTRGMTRSVRVSDPIEGEIR